MAKKWLSYINLFVASLAILLLVGAGFIGFLRPDEIVVCDTIAAKAPLPKGAFTMPKEACDSIGAKLFELKFSPISMQLPDLKKHLVYYGKNGRPDAPADRPVLHFSFTGNTNLTSIIPGERLYIQYDKTRAPSRYIFSPNNVETPIWMEVLLQGNDALVKLSMKDENGEIIRQPHTNAEFTLPEKEYSRTVGKAWEIGKWRVDGGLLARQKARWVGSDKFLEKHGGDEYKELIGKQRIDFVNQDEEVYSVYVGLNDSLVWEMDRWKVVKPGENSLGQPLMVVKKVDERLMSFELWDIGGKGRMPLNLIRTQEPWMPKNIEDQFKFVGARTRSQYIFEINSQRMMLSPHDWVLQTEEGWTKLISPEDIDNYVERRSTGVLFVFDEVMRVNERQVLIGTMFNAARTEMQPVEIVVQQGLSHATPQEETLNNNGIIDDEDDSSISIKPDVMSTLDKKKQRNEGVKQKLNDKE